MKPPLELKDKTGCRIPSALHPLWLRSVEVNVLLRQLSHIKGVLEQADKNDDPLWREPFLNKAIAELESVYGNLSTAKPYAVCAICQGRPETQSGGCRGCKGRGFMSRFRWERVPEKTRNMRTKTTKPATARQNENYHPKV